VSRVDESRLDEEVYPSRLLLRDEVAAIKTVVLAGGKGTRLAPYTSILPKPLLPLGDRAILELVMHQLARQGFVDITLSVGHLAHLIEAVLGNGADRSVDITYVREDVPLGTAGSLRLVEGLEDTFLVLNGDLVTTLDYRDIVRDHQASDSLLTIATRQRQVKIDYGVITVEAGAGCLHRVVRYEEKPVLDPMVSMGIYVMEPQVLDFIPVSGYFDFPDLVQKLLDAGAPIGAFMYDGLWLDIGRHEDYEQALALWEDGRLASLQDGADSPQPPVFAAGCP
jgi:NDP-mannose synthase